VGFALRPRVHGGEDETYEMIPQGAEVLPLLGSPGCVGLARAIARFKPSVVHTHDGRGPRALRYILRRPASVGTLHLDYKPRAMGGLDGIIRIAPWQRVGMRGFRGLSTTVLNWMWDPKPVSAFERAALRSSLGLDSSAILVGFVGRLHPVKGAEVLIRAFLRTAPANAHLAIVGDGAERAALEALAQGDPRIHFAGRQMNIERWNAAFDLFVQPSLDEPFGLVTLEAMKAGIPIVATATEGSTLLLKDSFGDAALVPPGDEDALAEALQRRFARGPAGFRRTAYDLSRFDGGQAAARIEDFYRRVIEARGERSRTWRPPAAVPPPVQAPSVAPPRKKASHG
jgi:glycosyltransferase involved in cell wall biosynthesis